MIDRDDAIRNLCFLRTWCEVNPQYGMGLNMKDCAKAVKWLDDAIALLKAQEPMPPGAQEARIMTLKEILEADVVWLETKENIMQAQPYKLMTSSFVKVVIRVDETLREKLFWAWSYSNTWRCWTTRPTDAQREATSWESQS